MKIRLGQGPWRFGPPPSIGWWPAEKAWLTERDRYLRYWNGEWWSAPCAIWHNAKIAGELATEKAMVPQDQIIWRERGPDWPTEPKETT